MAHKTLIDGIAYEISGGKCKVNGAAYSIKNGNTKVVGTWYEIPFVNGILASELAVGSTVKLMENGVATEYLVVHSGRPSTLYDASCDGLWLMRKDVYSKLAWNSNYTNKYANSSIHSFLNGSFLEIYDSITKNAIKTAKIPYCAGNSSTTVYSGSNGLSAKIFLLSFYELGFTSRSGNHPVDGAKLSYFTSGDSRDAYSKRIAYYNGIATRYWTRTSQSGTTNNAVYVKEAYSSFGSASTTAASTAYGVRPALILPSNALFDPDTMQLLGVA